MTLEYVYVPFTFFPRFGEEEEIEHYQEYGFVDAFLSKSEMELYIDELAIHADYGAGHIVVAIEVFIDTSITEPFLRESELTACLLNWKKIPEKHASCDTRETFLNAVDCFDIESDLIGLKLWNTFSDFMDNLLKYTGEIKNNN